ncbi:MAG: PLP-dependent cysteine synthase family protein [Candidatus Thermoplasmatota archaeon]
MITKIANSVLELIGNTPMVKIEYLNPNKKVDMYLKMEKFNPSGSVKDRIAKYMIEYAEKEGLLTKDKTVIEATSGNTGIGLALVCAVKGYDLVLVMPETMTTERRMILLALGAKIILSPGEEGIDGAQDLAKKIINKNPNKYFMPNQYDNKYNVLAHYETTAEEIWRDTNGKVTHFVGGIGTSGTLMGVSKKLKEYNSKIKIIGVEHDKNTPIPGLRNLKIQYVPKIWSKEQVDEIYTVTLSEAEETARLLSLREGIFAGISTGGIFRIAMKISEGIEKGVIVAMAPDGGERYITTSLCDPKLCIECAKKYGIRCSYVDGKPLIKVDRDAQKREKSALNS